jgi:branched-subunit amino acid ABC-type transport system permease component
MTRFFGYVVGGIADGTVYALVVIGIIVVYRVSRVINLAHGSMGIFATYMFHYVFIRSLGAPVLVAFLLTLIVGGFLGVGVELCIAPVRRRGTLVTLVMTVSLLLFLSFLATQIWGPNTPPIKSIFSDHTVKFGGTGVTVHQIGTAAIVVVLGAVLYVVLNRTRYGTAIEAIAEDPGAARIVGLPVTSITTAVWAIGGASAALAGMLYIHTNTLDQISLTFVLITALVAAVLGGFNSLPIAVGGSIALGIVHSVAEGYVSTAGFPDLVVFVALAAILLLRTNQSAALEALPEF